MLNAQQKEEFASLRVEVLDLDVCVNFFIRKSNRFAYLWRETSRAYILEELTALRYLENGVILHLMNLDDDNSKYSFRSAAVAFNKTCKDQKVIRELKEDLKTYRKNLNRLKVEYRNHRIAHLNYDDDLRFDQFLPFESILLPIVLEANEIAEKLWGEPIRVVFDLGSWEGKLDFKKNLAGLKRDINAITGFSSNELMA